MKKILVTGNMGYIGPHVVRHLRGVYPRGTLLGLDAGYFAHCLTHRGLLPETRVDLQYFTDIRDVQPPLLEGVDGIVHLAAISNDAMGRTNDRTTLDINYRASIRLAEMARQAGVKSFVFASSCSTYGFAEDGPRTELSPINPLTAYARSKVLTEKALAPLAAENFKVTCLRFATACGMSERLRLDLVLNDFVAAALTARKIQILSDGKPWRPLIHVKDMARAIEWALGRPMGMEGPYLVVNAGSDEWNYQVRDLAFAVKKAFRNGVTVAVNDQASPDKRSYRVSFDKYRKLAPRHQPQVSLNDAIRELREGLQSFGFKDARFRESQYVRLNVLSGLTGARYLSSGIRLNKNYDKLSGGIL